MPFDWDDFLALAQTLAGQYQANEADIRTAISRAYYSAFNAARERLPGNPPRGTGLHEWCWKQYKSARGNTESIKIGTIGLKLRDMRVNADYKNPSEGPLEVQKAIRDASTVRHILLHLGAQQP